MVRRRTATVILVAVILITATVAYGVITADGPQIESIDNEWGTVTDEQTEVETRIAVDNPLLLRVGDTTANISYTISANDIVLASERNNRVRLAGSETTVAVSTKIDNDQLPAWWASHIDEDETTEVRIEPDVTVDYAGTRLPADRWTYNQTVQTDLLEPLQTNHSQQVRAYDRTIFVVEETDAQWGNATTNRTPIEAEATVTNPTRILVPITEIEYTIRLNDIVVGEGIAAEQTVIEPDSTRSIEANAAIDNSELDEWWVTHLQNDETSNLTVDFTATLEYAGIQREVPLDFLSYDRTFETDLLGSQTRETPDQKSKLSSPPLKRWDSAWTPALSSDGLGE